LNLNQGELNLVPVRTNMYITNIYLYTEEKRTVEDMVSQVTKLPQKKKHPLKTKQDFKNSVFKSRFLRGRRLRVPLCFLGLCRFGFGGCGFGSC
jgi:hypothetical protein